MAIENNSEIYKSLYIAEVDSVFKSGMWGYSQLFWLWKFVIINFYLSVFIAIHNQIFYWVLVP